MDIDIQLTDRPIADQMSPPTQGLAGAWVEFRGVVRGQEGGDTITALKYEAYPDMAEREIKRLLLKISEKHSCLAAKVIHRTGLIPVGETAIYVGIAGKHRGEAFALLAEFMDRLKQDVPIWKRQAVARSHGAGEDTSRVPVSRVKQGTPHTVSCKSLAAAMSEIRARCQPVPAVPMPLSDVFGCVLRETVTAREDWPSSDRSTRDGYAILKDDASAVFTVVDTLHAADWKPRQLRAGEAVRVATGSALPSEGLRVVMQEYVERTGDRIKLTRLDPSLNVRKRGEDARAGQPILSPGTVLDAGQLALLATAGQVTPLVSPRLRVVHFTTGDEIIPPDRTPQPGQVRDSNSILIRGLLQRFHCDVQQAHLPEDFDRARAEVKKLTAWTAAADLLLVSGGASVGDKDFTRPLLEHLGYTVIFSQVDVRPGRPLIFGAADGKVAFGLPGNPLSHFACFHFAVTTALAALAGRGTSEFLRGRLAVDLADAACPRETLWPARLVTGLEDPADPQAELSGLHPLPWASSGDVTCFAAANALIRVPAQTASLSVGTVVDFLPAGSNFVYEGFRQR